VIKLSDDKDFGLVATHERGHGQEVIRGKAFTAATPTCIEIHLVKRTQNLML
jgi:hypothetical protein